MRGANKVINAFTEMLVFFLPETINRDFFPFAFMNSLFSRFHSFLLFMGHPPYAIREVNINKFCKIISEFALEYRTTRERVLQQKQKRANHRERNKTRGKMITDVSGKMYLPQHGFLKLSFIECHI